MAMLGLRLLPQSPLTAALKISNNAAQKLQNVNR